MDERTERRIEGWDSRPLTGGFAELRELADDDFSGAARSGAAWLFMLNGRVVGVFGGTIESFGDGRGTVYKAPHPSLPLLFTMLEEGGTQQAKYYTNETPISQAHQQLSDAQFTGYVELSENVLSGDYYVVYYGGRSMSCAFVGNAERLETGDRAFELADDEVGIYEVRQVDLEVTDIPDPEPDDVTVDEPGDGTAAAGTDGGTAAEDSGGEPSGGASPETAGESSPGTAGAGGTADADDGSGDRPDATPSADADGRSGSPRDDPSEQAAAGEESPADAAPPGGTAGENPSPARREPAAQEPNAGEGAEPAGTGSGGDPSPHGGTDASGTAASGPAGGGTATGASGGAAGTGGTGGTAGTGGAGGTPGDGTADPAGTDATGGVAGGTAGAGTGSSQQSDAEGGRGGGGSSLGVPKREADFGELRAIPSLSPSRTSVADADDGPVDGTATEAGIATDGVETAGGTGVDSREEAGVDPGPGGTPEQATAAGGPAGVGGSDDPLAGDAEVTVGDEDAPADEELSLREQLQQREARVEELEAALTDLRVQRDGLTDERDRLQSEVERLQREVADLEEEVERLRNRLGRDGSDTVRLSPEEALRGTNLFVRYDTKGGGTLEKAHSGELDADEVNENLRLEHHTQFDADAAVVDEQPFEAFLAESIYASYVEWVVRDLLYEIRETGHAKPLVELYDAIPKIDRVELLGEVTVEYTEDGEQYREQRAFDVVLRDRMGNPLLVADINDSRNPADRETMAATIEHARDVKESNESLAAGMLVTASFFEPGALEAAEEAAGGGLFGRSSKESYVKVARKAGYHLVLVESRGEDFHVNVPEL